MVAWYRKYSDELIFLVIITIIISIVIAVWISEEDTALMPLLIVNTLLGVPLGVKAHVLFKKYQKKGWGK